MPDEANKQPIILPALKHGISIAFNDYDLEGKPQWMIHDDGRNKFFVIGWMEYEILSHWHLADAEAVLEAVNSNSTLEIDMTDIEAMLVFLKQHFLLTQSGYQIYASAKEQKLYKNDNPFHWLINYYLFFRIPLFHPNTLLDKTKIVGQIFFSKITLLIMSMLGILAVYQISEQWETFTHTFSSIFSLEGLCIYLVVFVITKLFHELGHAYMCKSFNVPVPTLGIAFLVFWPVLYTDTTLSWSLNNKSRMKIALAGMWVETYFTIIAALIWCNSSNTTLQSICYIVVAVNWVASLLINVSPFMRFDGYYVLADFLKMPNLQSRAFALARWQLRKWLFGWKDPVPEQFGKKLHVFLVAYAFTTWIYRLALYIGIAVLVYHFFVKIVGIILFLIELHYFILGPIVKEVQVWYAQRQKFNWNVHTIIITSILAIGLVIFFTPLNQTIKLPATISYAHRFIIAPEDGIIASEPPAPGSQVIANQPILILQSDTIENDLRSAYLDYKKTSNELRRSLVNAKYSHMSGVLESELSKQKATYQKISDIKKTLTITAPFNGKVVELSPDLQKGNIVMKNELLGDVIQPNVLKVEAFVRQIDLNLLKPGLKGYFYPSNLSYPRLPVSVAYVEVMNSNELSCSFSQELKQDKKDNSFAETPCYNVSELGGEIATYTTDDGKFVPVDSIYRVLLSIPSTTSIDEVQRGTVVLRTESHSYAYELIYAIKRHLIEQSGF